MNIYGCQAGFGNEVFGNISLNIYVSGCKNNKKCPMDKCHNPELRDFNNGFFWKLWKNFIIDKVQKDFFTCFCLLGGEVLDQDPQELLKFIQFLNLFDNIPVYMYSGYSPEEIAEKCYNFHELIYGVFAGHYIEGENNDHKDLIIFNEKAAQIYK